MATLPDGLPARGLTQDQLVERVRRALSAAAGPEAAQAMPVESFREQSTARLPAQHVLAVMRALKSDPEAAFDMCLDVTCVHLPRRPLPLGAFDVVYHLLSVQKGHRLRLKAACPDPDAGIDSITPVWRGAGYLEREAYDMFGVRFNGHPDLRRILMAPEFEGWPLRKDFPYRGH